MHTVTPATLTIDADNTTSVYGQQPKATYTLKGLVNGETSDVVTGTVSCQTGTSTQAGTYPNTVTCTAGSAAAPNYVFASGRTGTLTISKAPLTVAARSTTVAYGDPSPVLATDITGFVRGETLTTSGVTGTPSCATPATPQSPAGTYAITCTPGTLAAANYSFTVTPGTLIVLKRPATLINTGALFVSTGSTTATTASVTLEAQLTAAPGGTPDLTKATVDFLLYKSTNTTMDTPDLRCSANVNARGAVACKLSGVPVDSWIVTTAIPAGNQYFAAVSAEPVVLTVYQPASAKLAVGVGWVTDPGYQNLPAPLAANKRGTFGFVVGAKANGTPVGQSVYTFRGANGYRYIVRSTSWQGGSVVLGASTVSFTARCDVIVFDPASGRLVPALGMRGLSCRADAIDKPGRTPDTYSMSVRNPDGSLYHQVGTPTGQLPLQGGVVMVMK